jgi:hypothetical protein
LCTVRHEAFEVGLGDSMAGHDMVEVMPKNNLMSLNWKSQQAMVMTR